MLQSLVGLIYSSSVIASNVVMLRVVHVSESFFPIYAFSLDWHSTSIFNYFS